MDCQYLWGAAAAGHLLGQALAGRNNHHARAALHEALQLQRWLGDPKVVQTERLLQQCTGP
jgi:hypothetical protein